jgi:hypothetical protein
VVWLSMATCKPKTSEENNNKTFHRTFLCKNKVIGFLYLNYIFYI